MLRAAVVSKVCGLRREGAGLVEPWCESRIAERKGAGRLERASVGQGRLRDLAFSEQAEAFRELGL